MFSSLNFIFAYGATDKAIRLVNTSGKIVHTINVCAYQKSGVNGNTLSIVLEDNNKEYKLQFTSNNDAKQALIVLRQALNTLRVNCKQVTSGGGSGDPLEPIEVTYLQYKALANANNLVPLQWYDVTDSTSLLFSTNAYIIRLLAKTSNDKHPRGQVLSTHNYVTLNVDTDNVVYYEDALRQNVVINGDINGTGFNNSTNNIITNESRLLATNSDYILIENNSQATVTSCSRVNISNGSNLVLVNVTSSSFDNIQQNLSALTYALTNVHINRHSSIGKIGRLNTTNPAGTITLKSYRDVVSQDYTFNGNNNTIILSLDNEITQAQGKFEIRYKGIGTGNIIVVKDKNLTEIFSIKENHKNAVVTFFYNPLTGLFELEGVASGASGVGKTVVFTNVTNNQINFSLGYPVTVVAELEMRVNGNKLINGLDFNYDTNIAQVVYAARHYKLQVGDEVEFKVY